MYLSAIKLRTTLSGSLCSMTTGAAVLFMLTSIALSVVSSRSGGSGDSVLEQVPVEEAETLPSETPDGLPALPPADTGTATDEAAPADPPPTD